MNITVNWTSLAFVSSRYNRKEDMKQTGKREPMKLVYKIGYNDDGSIVSLQMDFHMDGECECEWSALAAAPETVMCRVVSHWQLSKRKWECHLSFCESRLFCPARPTSVHLAV